MKTDDIILQFVTRVATFIIFTFSIYLLLAGHHNPGGGFIGGLITASAIVLLYLAYDIDTIKKAIPADFKNVAALGVLIAIMIGFGSVFSGAPFLSHTFWVFHLPLFGETKLATGVLFSLGVYLAVVGTTVTIVLSISEDI
ncbi:Na(+)/H(+) antiporter subunit B [bacterium LRH843]|nr:Na(+)/H(+) antiporter subunit B [bacterium LRH843]